MKQNSAFPCDNVIGSLDLSFMILKLKLWLVIVCEQITSGFMNVQD